MSGPGFEKRLREFLASDDFEDDITRFMQRNAKIVAKGVSSTGEFSPEVHEIWQDYLVMLEKSMQNFQREENLSDMEFKLAVEDVASRQPMLVKLMIASWEFEQFVEVCKEYSESLEEENDDGKETGDYDYKDEK